MNKATIFLLIIFVSGCLSQAVSGKNAKYYAQNAQRATQAGEWDKARRLWARAVGNSSLADSDKRARAVINYEYARSLGVTCFYDLAEDYFELAYKFDKETNGPTYMSMVELSRMFLLKKDYKKAIVYFEKAVSDEKIAQVEKHDPIGFTEFLDDYMLALNELQEMNKAAKLEKKSKKLKENNQGKNSKTDLTPYGSQCTNPEYKKSL